ncbi:ribosomal protein L5 [Dothidotthia symphoricarpi CBS 119687]|uniref:Large ribosomal subunit protein uL5m n=1 Tax=Dothidotthia symphoricarpi CBS 119687 TaxID=1392245 RepID=A0A6A6AA40_9PLEO|nr:ribosomal protein L5 [Dothidotthia symphoricarpi CBS 119687]KAF2128659.1 ribosomal protein L5 [Dothidotthia symphoricarpi CBS 119687]
MALRELPSRTLTALCRDARPAVRATQPLCRRNASSDAAQEVESASSFEAPPLAEELVKDYDPMARSRLRRRGKKELPPSRYQYRSPKYYRGPLHPHQPPPASDPSSRLFQPGPFTLPRLEQTYQSTIASDILALTYQHYPPGYRAPKTEQRLREWTGDSPYYKGRPLRGPRGKGEVLRLLNAPRTFRNIPKITKVVVHSMVPEAQESSAVLHVAGMTLQAISNVRVVPHKARHNVVGWNLREGRYVSVTSTLEREDADHFLAKLIDVVLPKIKEWKGVPGSSGDGHGNMTFGLTPDQLALFPEIEVNYDAYPPKMIPGCHITICTDATSNKDARLLLQAIGIPFYGKLND